MDVQTKKKKTENQENLWVCLPSIPAGKCLVFN